MGSPHAAMGGRQTIVRDHAHTTAPVAGLEVRFRPVPVIRLGKLPDVQTQGRSVARSRTASSVSLVHSARSSE